MDLGYILTTLTRQTCLVKNKQINKIFKRRKNMKDENEVKENEVKYKLTTAIELIDKVKLEPEPIILWNGIPEGSTGLITGAQKTGKSTFAQNLVLSIAVGRKEFFGQKMDGIPRKVAYINLEESYRLYSRRLDAQITTLKPDELILFKENFIDTPVDFHEFITNDEEWADLRDYLKRSEAEVIVLDSLTHMVMGEIEKSHICQAFIQKFRKYIRSLGKTVLVVHHNTKANDKPIEPSNTAGSRVILQEFEFALAFAEIPTQKGGRYCCMVFNKYVENDSSKAYLYNITPSRWFENVGEDNKYALYKETGNDFRINPKNRDLILDFIQSQCSQGSQHVITKELIAKFVTSGTMSKDTLHKSLNKLVEEGNINRLGTGKYSIKKEDNNLIEEATQDEEKGDSLQSPK